MLAFSLAVAVLAYLLPSATAAQTTVTALAANIFPATFTFVGNSRYNVKSPAATPVYVPFVAPTDLPIEHITKYRYAASAKPGSALASFVNSLHLKRGSTATNTTATYIDSTANDTVISTLWRFNRLPLPQRSHPDLHRGLLLLLGNPTDLTRATIQVANVNVTAAISGNLIEQSGCTIQNIQIDGGRVALGSKGGYAMCEMGGNAWHQRIMNVKAFEPRGWTAMHIIEGWNHTCVNASIINNEIGSSGIPTEGLWANGISLACAKSTVTGNTITDATDGGIVVFGAPGSYIFNNTIISNTRRQMFGHQCWSDF